MALFAREEEMQRWLRRCFDDEQNLGDLIANIDILDRPAPADVRQSRIFKSFQYCLRSLRHTEIISDNENISLKPGDKLCPDFLLYGTETQSLIVVELKNLGGATREAGTELGAYAAEVRTYLPFLSDGDTINVVISTAWPTLLKHHILHEIFWMQRNVICLEPVRDGADFKLQIKHVGDFADAEAPLVVGEQHIGGYQLCLYDEAPTAAGADKKPMSAYTTQMKAALRAMASKGNAQKSHGFAFLWKDKWTKSLAPYSITLANFAAFQSVDRFVRELDATGQPTDMQLRFIKIVSDHGPDGHGQALEQVTDYGCEFLQQFCTPRIEGFHTWVQLLRDINERAALIAFQGWGVFETEFFDALKRRYEDGHLDTLPNCPALGFEVVDRLVSLTHEKFDLSYYFYEPDEDDS